MLTELCGGLVVTSIRVHSEGPAFEDLARTRQAYLNIKNWNTRIHPVIAAIVPPGVK